MNREEILKVCRVLVEKRVTRTPRIVGSAALVLHGIIDESDDVNILLKANEWGQLTSNFNYHVVPHVDHAHGTIATELRGHPVTFAQGGHEHFKLTEVESDGVGFLVSYPTLVELLNRYLRKNEANPRPEFEDRIAHIRAAITASAA